MHDPNYWLVGASWGGVEHQDERFVKGGFWLLGWEQGHQPQKASQLQEGDRIAIKRMRGQGNKGIRIMHLGIIRSVIPDVNKVLCTVDWVATNLKRDIEDGRGAYASIHGPYAMSDPNSTEWLREIFAL